VNAPSQSAIYDGGRVRVEPSARGWDVYVVDPDRGTRARVGRHTARYRALEQARQLAGIDLGTLTEGL
jgi:hypothetical protein